MLRLGRAGPNPNPNPSPSPSPNPNPHPSPNPNQVTISVLNSLRARGGSTHAREASAAVVQLDGADLRGTGVGFRLLAPPTHGANPNPGPDPDPNLNPDPNPNPR